MFEPHYALFQDTLPFLRRETEGCD